MRRSLALPAVAIVATIALGIAPVQAEDAGQPRAKSAEYTIMGDSHFVLMFSDLYPGAYANGREGTVIDHQFRVYALNGIKLSQVVRGRGVVKAGELAVGTTNVNKWRKAISSGPDTIVVNLGTNDGGPRAQDIDTLMRLAGKDRRVFWVEPYYRSCPACRAIHDYELKAAAKRFANFHIIKTRDLKLDVSSDGLHAFGKSSSRALWDRIREAITPPPAPAPAPAPSPEPSGSVAARG